MAVQDLCTLDDVRLFLELDTDDTDPNTKITELITPASDAIIAEVNRELAPVTTDATRRVRVDTSSRLEDSILVSLAPYDVQADGITVVTLNPESSTPTVLTAMTDYIGDPEPSRWGVYGMLRLSNGLPFSDSDVLDSFGFAYLDIEATWGFPSIPTCAKQACIETVAAWKDRGSSVLAYPRMPDGAATPTILQPTPTFALPDNARRLLWPLYRQRIF